MRVYVTSICEMQVERKESPARTLSGVDNNQADVIRVCRIFRKGDITDSFLHERFASVDRLSSEGMVRKISDASRI